jgi:hypothetical protein
MAYQIHEKGDREGNNPDIHCHGLYWKEDNQLARRAYKDEGDENSSMQEPVES